MLWIVWLLDLLNYADWRDQNGTITLVVLSLSRIACTNVTVHCYPAKAPTHIGTSGRPKCRRRSIFPPATCPGAASVAFWILVVIWRSEVLVASVTVGLADPGDQRPGCAIVSRTAVTAKITTGS